MKRMRNAVLVLLVSVFCMSLLSGCVVWREERQGQAALARARYEMQVMEIEAQSRLVAESLNAESEIVRARGIAEAMDILNQAITPEYLKHFWIRTLDNHDGVIYVATEIGFPIMPR